MKEIYEAVLANVITLEEYLTGITDIYRDAINAPENPGQFEEHKTLYAIDMMVYAMQHHAEELHKYLEGLSNDGSTL
jgi:hypothetical protein